MPRSSTTSSSTSGTSNHAVEVAFGIFDHLERRDVPLEQLYEERLQLIEAADRAGIFCYHLAEHHATPLGMSPSPSVFLTAVAMRTRTIHLVEEICMLDQLSGGRLEVGVGAASHLTNSRILMCTSSNRARSSRSRSR